MSDKTIIIDVREDFEFAASHVSGAINLPPELLMQGAHELDGVPKDTKIVVYCRTGARSNVAMNILKSYGFTNVINGINKDHVESRFL